MFKNILAKLLTGGAGEAAIAYFNKKQELKQQLELTKLEGKIELEKARAQYRAQQLQSNTELAQTQLNSRGNWLRQDWVLLLLSIPLVLVFIPATQMYVIDGFAVLDTCPSWYRYMIGAIFLAIYGIRGVASLCKGATKK